MRVLRSLLYALARFLGDMSVVQHRHNKTRNDMLDNAVRKRIEKVFNNEIAWLNDPEHVDLDKLH